MIYKFAYIIFFLLMFVGSGVVGQSSLEETDIFDMADPTSTLCSEQGGEIVEIENQDSDSLGFCKFPNDKICGQWEFVYDRCTPYFSMTDRYRQDFVYQTFQAYFDEETADIETKLAMSLEMIDRTDNMLSKLDVMQEYKLVNNIIKKWLLDYREDTARDWIKKKLQDKNTDSLELDTKQINIVFQDLTTIKLEKYGQEDDLRLTIDLDWDDEYNLDYYIN